MRPIDLSPVCPGLLLDGLQLRIWLYLTEGGGGSPPNRVGRVLAWRLDNVLALGATGPEVKR